VKLEKSRNIFILGAGMGDLLIRAIDERAAKIIISDAALIPPITSAP
jgi:hypothetical protein